MAVSSSSESSRGYGTWVTFLGLRGVLAPFDGAEAGFALEVEPAALVAAPRAALGTGALRTGRARSPVATGAALLPDFLVASGSTFSFSGASKVTFFLTLEFVVVAGMAEVVVDVAAERAVRERVVFFRGSAAGVWVVSSCTVVFLGRLRVLGLEGSALTGSGRLVRASETVLRAAALARVALPGARAEVEVDVFVVFVVVDDEDNESVPAESGLFLGRPRVALVTRVTDSDGCAVSLCAFSSSPSCRLSRPLVRGSTSWSSGRVFLLLLTGAVEAAAAALALDAAVVAVVVTREFLEDPVSLAFAAARARVMRLGGD